MKKSRLLICIIIAVLMLGVLSGCSVTADSRSYLIKDSAQAAAANSADKKLYASTAQRENLQRVSRSDMTVLYFDKGNYSVCIYDSSSKMLWRALPQNPLNERAAMLEVSVLKGGQEYIFNSQDDSVAPGLSSFEVGDNGVCITYNFEKELENGEKISFAVPVVFSATDGLMSVEIDCSKLKKPGMSGDAVIKEIKLLNYFGASTDGEKGDYIFVPDGSGAIIDTAKKPKSFKGVSIPVYGAAEGDSYACIPSFGIKAKNAAFVALVEEGDALATISAQKALAGGGLNRVGASFAITHTQTSEDGKRLYISGNSYSGKLRVSYRFLSDDTANYTGMASACRELLIRNGVLNMQEQKESKGSLPFNLSLIGAADFAKSANSSRSSVSELTTFDQAHEILSYLNGKGIGNINLRYRGIFVGALEQKNKLSVSKLVSGKFKIEELTELSQNRNVRLFADLNLVSAAKDRSFKSAVGPNSKAVVSNAAAFESNMLSSPAAMNCSAYSTLERNANSLLTKARKLEFEGVCFGDVGSLLYSDCSKKAPATRQAVKQEIEKQISAFSSSKSIMVSGGNIYTLKYASAVANLPNRASCQGKLCTSVPFLQTVLHGYVDYSSTAFNLAENSEEAFLKAAEYGEVPGYEGYYADYSTEEEKDSCSYMSFALEAKQYYERLNAVFFDLGAKKITAHEKVKSGVYSTKFGSSTSVYVNYNQKDVRVNGVVVEARSILRVN